MRSFKVFFLPVVLAAATALPAQPIIAYAVPAGAGSNQFIPNPLGMDFNVNLPVLVLSLGVFDSGQNGLTFDHVVRIYDRNTQLTVALATIPAGSSATLIGGSRFVPLLSPLVLPAGFQGSIVAEIDPTDGNGNTNGGAGVSTLNDGGGFLTFVGGGRVSDNGPGVFPARLDGGPVNRYLAGTFEFVPIPEPATWALIGLGAMLATVCSLRRRRLNGS
jgi:hypothetical protein